MDIKDESAPANKEINSVNTEGSISNILKGDDLVKTK